VLVIPTIVGFLPNPWGRDISEYMPSDAGQALLSLHASTNTLAPWTGFAVTCGWAALALAAATWLVTRRDARSSHRANPLTKSLLARKEEHDAPHQPLALHRSARTHRASTGSLLHDAAPLRFHNSNRLAGVARPVH